MNSRRVGARTFCFPTKPVISGAAAVVGVKEGKGPQARWFDKILQDDYYGEKTFEKAESKLLKNSITMAIEKAGLKKQTIDVMLTGDLLNQLMSSSYMARDVSIPYLGLYGACSTMTESILLASVLVDGGFCTHTVAGASSHFATAERQFRMPLEHGNQRPPQAQWTATAAGAVTISQSLGRTDKPLCCITHGTVGRVVDPGITDTNFMGAAMAPAAFDTIRAHLTDTGRKSSDYDLILTGDLGRVGKKILLDLALKKSSQDEKDESVFRHFRKVYEDCGAIMYEDCQDTHAGGSGCGCSASIFAGRIVKEMRAGKYKRVLLVSTGALISTISKQQGETVPGIAHAVTVEVM
ncbi:MAG: stage V sporulation protein AD [Firmicutes bacterium]|nr:stage V sporulation protein AD [Bacillota bacterium]